ncbi:MAG: hypothetical protein DRI90_19275 [Deltaproteobacteria bacterium]|nr:MAG: hypothetical protein DRI90_19275 [Deltaproteobacteria bacterium]
MKRTQKRALPAGVKELRGRIEQWRRTRKGRSRMPEPLWDGAVAFARVHGVYGISQALRVSYDSLKTRLTRAPKAEARRQGSAVAADFVELAAVSPLMAPPATGTVVELVERNGAKLTISLAAGTPLDVAALMRGFRSRRR